MHILLTNDDGVYSPGLAAMQRQLERFGDVTVVAPVREQSGVSHSITFLTPLTCKEVGRGESGKAWAVDGSPADCSKWAISHLLKDRPVDLVVSGINNGLNAGINVLYSGTVAAAVEASFFGITAVAISLEDAPGTNLDAGAKIAGDVVQKLIMRPEANNRLFNLNIPTAATVGTYELKIAPLGLSQYGRSYEKRTCPSGRDYHWALWSDPIKPPADDSDVRELRKGNVTLTPLKFDMADHAFLEQMSEWDT